MEKLTVGTYFNLKSYLDPADTGPGIYFYYYKILDLNYDTGSALLEALDENTDSNTTFRINMRSIERWIESGDSKYFKTEKELLASRLKTS